MQLPYPEINSTQADNFIFRQLVRNLKYPLYKIQNYASPNLSEAT